MLTAKQHRSSRPRRPIVTLGLATILAGSAVLACGPSAATAATASATGTNGGGWFLVPGNLLVSTSFYDNQAGNVTPGQALPPGCTSGCGAATNKGLYPEVFNNDRADSSFGITSRIVSTS